MGFLAQKFIFHQTRKPSFANLPENVFKTDQAEQEYRLINLVNWTDFSGKEIVTLLQVSFGVL